MESRHYKLFKKILVFIEPILLPQKKKSSDKHQNDLYVSSDKLPCPGVGARVEEALGDGGLPHAAGDVHGGAAWWWW